MFRVKVKSESSTVTKKDLLQLINSKNIKVSNCFHKSKAFYLDLCDINDFDLLMSDSCLDALKSLHLLPLEPPPVRSKRTIILSSCDSDILLNTNEQILQEIQHHNAHLTIDNIFTSREKNFLKITLKTHYMTSLVLNKGLRMFNLSIPGHRFKQELFIDVNFCLKCLKLDDHITSNCRMSPNFQRCSRCSETGHVHYRCTSEQLKCANCEGAHNALSLGCPTRRAIVAHKRKQILSSKSNTSPLPSPSLCSTSSTSYGAASYAAITSKPRINVPLENLDLKSSLQKPFMCFLMASFLEPGSPKNKKEIFNELLVMNDISPLETGNIPLPTPHHLASFLVPPDDAGSKSEELINNLQSSIEKVVSDAYSYQTNFKTPRSPKIKQRHRSKLNSQHTPSLPTPINKDVVKQHTVKSTPLSINAKPFIPAASRMSPNNSPGPKNTTNASKESPKVSPEPVQNSIDTRKYRNVGVKQPQLKAKLTKGVFIANIATAPNHQINPLPSKVVTRKLSKSGTKCKSSFNSNTTTRVTRSSTKGKKTSSVPPPTHSTTISPSPFLSKPSPHSLDTSSPSFLSNPPLPLPPTSHNRPARLIVASGYPQSHSSTVTPSLSQPSPHTTITSPSFSNPPLLLAPTSPPAAATSHSVVDSVISTGSTDDDVTHQNCLLPSSCGQITIYCSDKINLTEENIDTLLAQKKIKLISCSLNEQECLTILKGDLDSARIIVNHFPQDNTI